VLLVVLLVGVLLVDQVMVRRFGRRGLYRKATTAPEPRALGAAEPSPQSDRQ
jgi:hypothetical protein